MDAAGAAVFLVARFLLMGSEGTDLLSEHRASVPDGGTGVIVESPDVAGLPGSVRIRLTPSRTRLPSEVPDGGGEDGSVSAVHVSLVVELWESRADAAAGRPPRETNRESLDLLQGTSGLVQLAEDPPRGRRLFLSLSSPEDRLDPPAVRLPERPEPGRINFRLEVYRGAGDARELLEQHHLMGVERSPATWETRWKRPLPRADGRGVAYRDEGLTLSLLPILTQPGWVDVEATLSAVLYAEGSDEPLRLSSSATRNLPLGIPFEISLDVPAEGDPGATGGEAGEAGGEAPVERSTFIVEVTPYRPAG